ncbi:MAG: LacI family DNA-binding transcriptional regulator [Bacteroidetes bacterium]|nr:LacI family DNA-binding transcriptional regulator [Bacteroidota bacterium]
MGKQSTKQQTAATLKEVAQAAKVSLTTASMALSGKGNVSEETREKVWEAAKELRYKRTVSQEKAVQEQLLTIGLIIDISSSTNHNWRHLRSYIEETQRIVVSKGGSFLLLPYNHLITEEENIRGIIKANVKGVVSFSYYNKSFLQKLENQGIPVVVFNNPAAHRKFVNVALDDFQSTYDAVKYLIDLGHRNILYIHTERPNLPSLSNNRYFAYQKVLEENRIPFREDYVVHFEIDSFEKNSNTFKSLMAKKVKPSAAICLDDDIAAGMKYILNNLGYSVPENMSLIAHGDLLDYSRFQTPRITTMRMDPIMTSKLAVDLLIEKLLGRSKLIQTVKVQEHLKDRGSCKQFK